MSASVENSGGTRRRQRGRARRAPMSEINVTPFVDVMLVLLIIFMVTAPLLATGVAIELPKTEAKQLQTGKDPLTITIDSKGKIFLGSEEKKPLALEQLVTKLRAIAKGGYSEPIYVRGDRQIDYGRVMQVMGRISEAGFKRVSLVTDSQGS